MKSCENVLYVAAALAFVIGLTAGPVTADQVFLDDVIVDGSLCVGFDCVDGESFGFDTIRLKENNLRIKFDDTSTSASFPNNDWQLTANDSANGGANKFSVDDITGGRTPFTIEATAPSHSLYVDDGGRLGFGTSTPVVELHVVDGDTPTLRLEQDGSSGFAPQTWDVAGNETNFFIRDVTNGSSLPFRIRPSAPTSSLDIAGSGNVGIGTTSPAEKLHVSGNANGGEVKLRIENLADGGNAWAFSSSDGGGGSEEQDLRISKQGSGGVEVRIRKRLDANNSEPTLSVDGSVEATNVTFTSSRTLKADIVPLEAREVLDRLAQLPVAQWRLSREAPGTTHYGPMAEDFHKLFELSGDGKTISMVDASGLTMAAVKGLNEKLEEENAGLRAELAELRTAVAEIAAVLGR